MKNKMVIEGSIKVAGVYQMSTKSGVVLYVGSALEVGDALSRHVYNLKRGKYQDTNKRSLQESYDREDLVFKVIYVSAHNNEVRDMDNKQKEDLQRVLGVLEELHIGLNRTTVCNYYMKVKKTSSSPTPEITEKRRSKNLHGSNPNCKYDEELIANILYLKEQGFKPKEIMELLLEQDIDVSNGYISQIGVYKWVHLESKCPEWYKGA